MESENIKLFADSSRGIYIPHYFITHSAGWHGISDDDRAALKGGPDNEGYWEAWESVLESAAINVNDRIYHLHQDGDLWAIALDSLTTAERLQFFGE